MADNIYEVNGSSYRVKVAYYIHGVQSFRNKSFSFKQYGGKQNALVAAKRYRDQMKVQLNTDNFILPSKTTMLQMMDYKEELISLTEETNKKHWLYFNKYINCNKFFEDITTYDIQVSLNKAVNTCSQDTINRIFAVWKYLYRVAQLKKLNCQNHCLEIIVPVSKYIPIKRELEVDKNYLNNLFLKLENYNCKNINSHLIVLALKTMQVLGTRPGETFALESSDIDLKNKTVLIKRSCNNKGQIIKTKTYTSYRKIPYPLSKEQLFKELKSYTGEIFVSGSYRLNSNDMSSILNRISNGTFREYMLRHKLATDLIIENGIDPKTVQYIMGHKNISQTLNYAIVKEDKAREAMERRI